MRILIRNHLCLCMTGISLHRLNVAAIQLQFVGDAGMTQAVKNNFRKVVLLNQLCKELCNTGLLCWHTQTVCQDQIIIIVFAAQRGFREILILFPVHQHFRHRSGQEYLSCTGRRLRFLQYKNRFIVCPNLRKYKNHIFFLKGLHGAFAYSLEFLIYKDGCLSGSNAFRWNIHTIPGQPQKFTDSQGTGKGQIDGQLQAFVLT